MVALICLSAGLFAIHIQAVKGQTNQPARGGNAKAAQPEAGQRGAGERGASERGAEPGATERGAGRRGRGGRGGAAQSGPGRGVLGGVPMTDDDNAVKAVVDRLSSDGYKELIKGLTQFGDRRQGTDRNMAAQKWIAEQLTGWGYTVERMQYEYRGQPREQVYATKVGSKLPGEMYILGGHMDGIGEGQAANDDGSGTALVLELARVLAAQDVQTARSVRFCLWNNEETGLNGATAYVEQRQALQGVEDPPGSGRYPEPKWLGMIQHDILLFDHGLPVQHEQVRNADIDVEFQLNSAKAAESAMLGVFMINSNRKFATDYPAVLSNAMSNTDSRPFMDHVAAVSVRDNRRLYEIGRGSNPHWHQPTDLFVTYSDADFRLGFNACQTTLSAIASLAEARIVATSAGQ
jgi:hypothetical protein